MLLLDIVWQVEAQPLKSEAETWQAVFSWEDKAPQLSPCEEVGTHHSR